VTTAQKTSGLLNSKYVIATIGSTAVLLAFSYNRSESPLGDFRSFSANGVYKFTAPKGKRIHYIFCKTASGTSTLVLTATDMDVDKIE